MRGRGVKSLASKTVNSKHKTNDELKIFKSAPTSCCPKMLCVLGKPKTTHSSWIRQRHTHDSDSDILQHVAASNASKVPKHNVHITCSATTFFFCAVNRCTYVIYRWRGENLTRGGALPLYQRILYLPMMRSRVCRFAQKLYETWQILTSMLKYRSPLLWI